MFPENGFWSDFCLALIGASGGLIVSGGVFTVLISVGLVPRFAGKTHTSRKVFLYEEMVVAGTLTGNVLSVFGASVPIGEWVKRSGALGPETGRIWGMAAGTLLILTGLFAGIFVGCLALSIAEMLDSIPIFARRTGFRHGLGIAVLGVALGKLLGSFLYFARQFFLTSG